jgi:hypothetical protein
LNSGCVSFERTLCTGNAVGIELDMIVKVTLHRLWGDTQTLEAHREKLLVLDYLNRQIVCRRIADETELIRNIVEQFGGLELGSGFLKNGSPDSLPNFQTRILDDIGGRI